jgi:hypothetical protein
MAKQEGAGRGDRDTTPAIGSRIVARRRRAAPRWAAWRRPFAAVGVALVLGPATAAAAQAATPPTSLTTLIARYVSHRPGTVSVSVRDQTNGKLWTFNGGMRNDTASIVKVDILETRLHQTGGHLSSADRRLATLMIEQSDNNAATALWNEDGGTAGVGAYNRLVGMACTTLGTHGYWGLTLTCARDQLRLLNRLDKPNPLLTTAARQYELYLMEHVVSWERWGVSGGVPTTGVTVALKNGWLPYGNAPWIVNSIGIIRGDGRYYYISVLTRDPTEATGINTIQGISSIVWANVGRTSG